MSHFGNAGICLVHQADGHSPPKAVYQLFYDSSYTAAAALLIQQSNLSFSLITVKSVMNATALSLPYFSAILWSFARRRNYGIQALLLLCLLFILPHHARAQASYTWVGGTAGNWQTASNWAPSRTTPGITD